MKRTLIVATTIENDRTWHPLAGWQYEIRPNGDLLVTWGKCEIRYAPGVWQSVQVIAEDES